jgi:GGDEF domain-containing protein
LRTPPEVTTSRGSRRRGETNALTVTASIGIANADEHSTAGDLLRDSDVALYQAKAAGKDCAIVFASERSTGRAELDHLP